MRIILILGLIFAGVASAQFTPPSGGGGTTGPTGPTGSTGATGSAGVGGIPNPACTFSGLATTCTINTASLNVPSANYNSIITQCWTGASTTQTALAITSYAYTTGSGNVASVAPTFGSAAAAGYCTANAGSSTGATGPTGPTGGGGGAGSFVLVEEHTASSSATLNFTTCISSTYDDYQIEFVAISPATNGDSIGFRMSTNGGSSYDAGANYSWSAFGMAFNGSGANGNLTDTAGYVSNGQGSPASTLGTFIGTAHLMDPLKVQNASGETEITATGFGLTSAGQRISFSSYGTYNSSTAVNAFQVLASTGNIASGTVRCYGLAH